MGKIADRIAELGIELPPPIPAPTDHALLVRSGQLVFMSAQGPLDAQRQAIYSGQVGKDLTEEEGIAAARLSALNTLVAMEGELGSLDVITQVVRLTGFVQSAPGFERQPWVLNGASEVFTQIFGDERGAHARSSVGVSALALGMACVIETVYEVA
jgi:enamine deaminase RidA (YjgF/YER057c/UK114 family)